MNTPTLDDLDKAILESLYMDARQGPEELAASVSADEARVRERLDALEDTGVLDDIVAVVDPFKVGRRTLSYHMINFERNYDLALEKGLNRFSDWDGTQLAMIVLGDYDVIARKLSKSGKDLDVFATNVLSDPDTGADAEYGPLMSQVYSIETFKVSQRIRWRGTDFTGEDQRDVDAVDLDDTQRGVVSALLEDGSLIDDIAGLATRAGAPRREVEDAITSLEDTDVILNYSLGLAPETVGLYRAFFAVSADRERFSDVVENVQEASSPLHVPYIVSGLGFNWADVAMELVFDSIEELDRITDELRELDGVSSSKTFLGTRVEYFDYAFPVA